MTNVITRTAEADSPELIESPERPGDKSPEISVLIPIYNEESILDESVREIVQACEALALRYELILCENGSRDRTAEIAKRLSDEFHTVRVLQYGAPNYGGALNSGIQAARGEKILCFEIDFYDLTFIEIARALLNRYDAVIASKRAPGAMDRRPRIRRVITWGFNRFLNVVFGFRGTDTHGIKAFRAFPTKLIAAECKTDRDIFATELVIRMERSGLRICEIPFDIVELRPAPINIWRRVPSTLKNLWKLRIALLGVERFAPKIKTNVSLGSEYTRGFSE